MRPTVQPAMPERTTYPRLCPSREYPTTQLKNGGQADAAEVMGALLNALSEVSEPDGVT